MWKMKQIQIQAEKLTHFAEDVLIHAGLPEKDAQLIADSLVHANLTGIDSHGIARLNDYLVRMDKNLVTKETKIDVVSDTLGTALLDANNGWGQVVSEEAVTMAIKKAKETGIAWVGVRNSNHYGTAAYWTSKMAKAGMIGMSMTNTSPVMVPFGSKVASLGTNPLSIAVPSSSGQPIILDMATSNQARGKITLAAKNNVTIPKDWAITAEGEETTDPHEALKGSLLPFGGAKGSGLAMMIDIMTGVLTGALFGTSVPRFYDDPVPQNLGHIFIAMNVEAMMPLNDFLTRMGEKENETRGSAPAKGFEKVLMPGDMEHQKAEVNRVQGILLSREIYEELLSAAKRYGANTSFIE